MQSLHILLPIIGLDAYKQSLTMFCKNNLLILYAILWTRGKVYCAENPTFFVGEVPKNRTCVHQSQELDQEGKSGKK